MSDIAKIDEILTKADNAVSLRFISFYHPLFFKIHIKYPYFV